MLVAEQCFTDMNNSLVRRIRARVELYEGSTLLQDFKHTDALKSITIERVGENGKFFGFGVCQKLNVKVIDKERLLDIKTSNTLDVSFGIGCDFIYPYPLFKVSEVHRDEITNELSITAYDTLYQASLYTVSDLLLLPQYTLEDFVKAAAALLGLSVNIVSGNFSLNYPEGANFDGTENLRDAINALAEATQTIYYIDNEMRLTFKQLDKDGTAKAAIDKSNYFKLDNRANKRLGRITHTTELGDNMTAATAASGSTQFIRDNPFMDLRLDIDTIIDNAILTLGGLTINQFECDWRGNILLEIGDKVSLMTKDNEVEYSFIIDDVITYDGSLREKTQWTYKDNDNETEANPTSIGDAIKQTFARVDKASREIELLASNVEEHGESLSSIILNQDSITQTVSKLEKTTTEAIEEINENLATITKSVEAILSSDKFEILVKEILNNGIDEITTGTGYTFNSDGLTVSKSDSEISTTITEDGMKVSKSGEEVLTADNEGVKAANLHATTYLIIGNNSRFEDYGERTGCFWIGEVNG